jgi:uncharacterized RmlC-like cupin family protein
MAEDIFKINIDKAQTETHIWGTIKWLCNSKIVPSAKQTFGYVTICPGRRNGEHLHPNCEEIIFVAQGECDHYIGNKTTKLRKGDMLFVPEGSYHYSINTSKEDLILVISYSDPDRETKVKDFKKTE